jgi:hypothetical protein
VEGSCEHGDKPSGFHRVVRSSGVAAQVATPPEELNSMELVISNSHYESGSHPRPTNSAASDRATAACRRS